MSRPGAVRGIAILACALLFGGLPLAGWKLWTNYTQRVASDRELGELVRSIEMTAAPSTCQLGSIEFRSERVVLLPDGSWKILASARGVTPQSLDQVTFDRMTLDLDGYPPLECKVSYRSQGPYVTPVDVVIQTPPLPDRCLKIGLVYRITFRNSHRDSLEYWSGEGRLEVQSPPLPSLRPTNADLFPQLDLAD